MCYRLKSLHFLCWKKKEYLTVLKLLNYTVVNRWIRFIWYVLCMEILCYHIMSDNRYSYQNMLSTWPKVRLLTELKLLAPGCRQRVLSQIPLISQHKTQRSWFWGSPWGFQIYRGACSGSWCTWIPSPPEGSGPGGLSWL